MMRAILCKLGGALHSMLRNCIGTCFHVGATPQGSTSNVVTACNISSDVDEVLVQEEAPAISKQAVNPSPRHAEASVVAPRRSKYSREIGLAHESSYYNEEDVADLAASDHATLACSSSFVVAEVVGEALTGELHATNPSWYVEEPVAPASDDAAINASGFAQDQAVSDTLRTFAHHTVYPSRTVEEVPAASDPVLLHVKAVIPQGAASDDDTTAHNSLAVQEGQPRHFKVQVKLMHNESGFVNCELELQLTGNAKQYESSICIIDLKDLEDAMQGKYKPVDITSGLARFDFTGSPLHAQPVAISCCAENPRPWFEVVPDLIRLLLRTKTSCVDLEISFVTQSFEKKLRSRWWSSTPDGTRRSSMVNTLEIPSSYHMGQEAIDRFPGLFFAVLCFAWLNDMPNLVKLVVYLRPWLACPISQDQALVVSTLMKCDTMRQVAKLLLKFNPSLLRSMSDQAKELFRIEEKLYKPSFLLNQNIHELAPLILLGQQHEPSILPWSKCLFNAVGKPFIFTRPAGLPRSVQDVQRCYGETVGLVHTLDKLLNKFWKFDARVSGLRSPWSTENSKQSCQNITLEVVMECEVVANCHLALKLSNLKFSNGGFHNYRPSSSSSAELGFFLSHVAVCVTPKVEREDCQLTKLEVDTALNQTYDFAGANASGWTGTLNLKSAPTVAFNKTTTATLVAKSVTDWYHAHGTELHDRKSGTFSWTLNRLGGIPFNYQKPYPFPTGTNFAGWSSSLPFDDFGSVVFTDKTYPHKITWMLAPKMEGRTVEWLVSVEFCVTILKNIRSRRIQGQSLTFRCTKPLEYKLIAPTTRH